MSAAASRCLTAPKSTSVGSERPAAGMRTITLPPPRETAAQQLQQLQLIRLRQQQKLRLHHLQPRVDARVPRVVVELRADFESH